MQNSIKRTLVSIVVIILSSISCNDPSISGSLPEITTIPFIASSNYKYSWKSIEIDSLGDTISILIDTVRVRIVSTNVNIGNDSTLVLLEAESMKKNLGITQVWYKQYKDSLLEIAYNNAGAVPTIFPKRYARINLRNIPIFFSVMGLFSDSVIYRPNGGRVVYQYPLTRNKKWVSFISPWLQTREVLGNELITTSAGTFNCARIFTKNVVDFTDYVAEEGLIKRTFAPIHATVTAEENPDITGEAMTIIMEQELISKN